MDRFRHMMTVVLLSGIAAGLILFAVQHFTIVPLIQKAEVYEKAGEEAEAASSGGHQHDEGWQPEQGLERTSFTALATVLTGIGFAAVLFGVVFLVGTPLDAKRGLLMGLAAFTCVGLAPAIGLPPQPPGVAVADLYARQIWWTGTVIATATALWLFFGKRVPKMVRPLGIIMVILPHLIGAPQATGQNVVPEQLIQRFTLLSIATTGMFWLLLGLLGGLLYQLLQAKDADPPGRNLADFRSRNADECRGFVTGPFACWSSRLRRNREVNRHSRSDDVPNCSAAISCSRTAPHYCVGAH